MDEDKRLLEGQTTPSVGQMHDHFEVQRAVTAVASREGCFCHLCNAAIRAGTPHLIVVTTFPTELSSFLSRSRVCLECIRAIAEVELNQKDTP